MAQDTPCADIFPDVKTFPTLVRHGAGVFSEFARSSDPSQPMMLGIWEADDLEDNKAISEPECNEVKYIISGESTWQDVTTGREFQANAGSVLWLRMDSCNTRVRSKSLTAFYVEQAFRPVTTVHPGPRLLYLDYVSEYSTAMFGYLYPVIINAITDAVARGVNLSAPGANELELAQAIKAPFRRIEKVRFCNSGTEANTMTLALATHVTNRRKILPFENAYHDGFLSFTTQATPMTLPHEFILSRFNDIAYTQSVLTADIAAIIAEPMQGAGGITVSTPEFLRFLRESATRLGAVLIFDEVVTWRLHINGLQGHFGIEPDLTTLGKYIGGGPSFDAFGGKASLIDLFDPRMASRSLPHSGAFNNNLFTMAAGVAAPKILTREGIEHANALGDKLRDGINIVLVDHGGLGKERLRGAVSVLEKHRRRMEEPGLGHDNGV
ncbi:pyridoxal phosphate-dependent transferase [Aspergillus karnatakaensis]|uniref:pyridoxal phosphate-dependent transferase n=1 Tax=Aspergillus karnatakaensis TaxID=1810916 RepID=UPI003CCE081C